MPTARRNSRIIFLLILLDGLAVAASFLTAYLLRFISGIIPATHTPPFYEYAKSLFVIVPVYLIIFRIYELYNPHRRIRRIEEIFIVIKGVTFSIVILMAITFFYRHLSYSRVYLSILWFLSIFFVSLTRYLFIQWEYYYRLKTHTTVKVMIIGANRNARNIIQWARSNPHYGKEVVCILARDEEYVGKHLEGLPITGASEHCERYIDELKPDEVILLDHQFSRDKIMDLVVLCEDRLIDFKVGADFYGLMTRSVDIEHISAVPLLGFKALPLDDLVNRMLKRTLDITVSSLFLFLTSPIWLCAAILIKSDDKGPIFYAQERVGRDGQVFNVLKFRTMRINAEKETGPVWAKPNDSRRTRVGDFFRRWNIDELPQLLNVLKGEMSLVGPRPERPHFVSQFRETIPRYMARHKIKAGLTGWAQVHGLRGNTSIHERLKYDLYYMENWSLLLDIEIMFMTIFAFKNAY